MEMKKSEFKEMGQELIFKNKGNFIDNISEIYDFLYYDCYSVPDISVNGELKHSTNLAWIRKNIDTKLINIKNYSFRYIDNKKLLEIKYINGDIVKLFED
jgi:hypothetical protein